MIDIVRDTIYKVNVIDYIRSFSRTLYPLIGMNTGEYLLPGLDSYQINELVPVSIFHRLHQDFGQTRVSGTRVQTHTYTTSPYSLTLGPDHFKITPAPLTHYCFVKTSNLQRNFSSWSILLNFFLSSVRSNTTLKLLCVSTGFFPFLL